MKRHLRLLAWLPVLVLTGGCVTHALWTEAGLDNWNEPAEEPNLRLYRTPGRDVLVIYDEYSERHNSMHTRAYLMRPNQKRIEERRHPRFVSVRFARGLAPIRVYPVETNVIAKPAVDFYAIPATNGARFTICGTGPESGTHQLPVYNDGLGRLYRIVLTPLGVTADATIVGGFLFMLIWSEGGLSGVH